MAIPALAVLEEKWVSLLESNQILREEVEMLRQQVEVLKHKNQHASEKVGQILNQLEQVQG